MSTSKMKILLLGDEKVGKSWLLNIFKDSCKKFKENGNIIQFEKKIKDSNFQIEILKMSEFRSDKIKKNIENIFCIFIIFDLTNRTSFNNLLEKWIIGIRDSTDYRRNIYILGNIVNHNEVLITDEEEINDLIEISEIKNTKYINIEQLSNKKVVTSIDKMILETKMKYSKIMHDNKNCIII